MIKQGKLQVDFSNALGSRFKVTAGSAETSLWLNVSGLAKLRILEALYRSGYKRELIECALDRLIDHLAGQLP